MLVTGGSRVITSFELPSSLGSAFTTGTFVKPMVVTHAILAATAAAVSPVPATRAAGGAGDVLPLHSAWGRRCFARGLDVNWNENAGASATGKASEIRVPKASGFVRSSIDVVSQSPTVYWQSGFARSALGSTVISPLPLLRPLGIGCPAIAAKRSIVYGKWGRIEPVLPVATYLVRQQVRESNGTAEGTAFRFSTGRVVGRSYTVLFYRVGD